MLKRSLSPTRNTETRRPESGVRPSRPDLSKTFPDGYTSHLMIVDDDPIIRHSLARVFQNVLQPPAQLLTSDNCEDANAHIKAMPDFSMIVCDQNIDRPNSMNGLDFALASIRQRIDRGIGFILYTGENLDTLGDLIMKFIERDIIDDAVGKNNRPEALCRIIHDVLMSKYREFGVLDE